ncbi:MAG: amino acid-binding protein [Bacteroidaceae bacterium]|nr:amino acid-binding protein [Bacteroidaceae bacterium]
MNIQQLSIFIENAGGTLIRVLDLLSQAGIQIIASTVADTQDYGIYRVLCDNPEKAFRILKDSGINVQLSAIFAISIDDEPGCAARVIKNFSDAGVSILYLYSFLWRGKGVLAFRADPVEQTCALITWHRMRFLTEEDFK